MDLLIMKWNLLLNLFVFRFVPFVYYFFCFGGGPKSPYAMKPERDESSF